MRDIMQIPSLSRLRHTYLDPSMNLIFGQMRDEIDQNRKTRDETQNELQAFQFTPDRLELIYKLIDFIYHHFLFCLVKLVKCLWQDVKNYLKKMKN